jgi:hypothetical protein
MLRSNFTLQKLTLMITLFNFLGSFGFIQSFHPKHSSVALDSSKAFPYEFIDFLEMFFIHKENMIN